MWICLNLLVLELIGKFSYEIIFFEKGVGLGFKRKVPKVPVTYEADDNNFQDVYLL
jgi:hypothetical protein